MQGPRTGICHRGRLNIPVTLRALFIQVDGLVEPILPGDELLPSQLF